MGKASITRFSDGEIYFQIEENVRGADVFIVQPSCTPVDSNLMELFLMIDAFKRSSARRITAVLPYFGYARRIARTSRVFQSPPSWFQTCSSHQVRTAC